MQFREMVIKSNTMDLSIMQTVFLFKIGIDAKIFSVQLMSMTEIGHFIIMVQVEACEPCKCIKFFKITNSTFRVTLF